MFTLSDMYEHRLRVLPVHALGDARHEHFDPASRTSIAAVEIEAVGRLRTACELSYASPELFDVVKRRDLVVEVVPRNIRRRAALHPIRVHPVIEHLPGVVEFE